MLLTKDETSEMTVRNYILYFRDDCTELYIIFQRRLYGIIYTACFHVFIVLCNCKLVSFFAKTLIAQWKYSVPSTDLVVVLLYEFKVVSSVSPFVGNTVFCLIWGEDSRGFLTRSLQESDMFYHISKLYCIKICICYLKLAKNRLIDLKCFWNHRSNFKWPYFIWVARPIHNSTY